MKRRQFLKSVAFTGAAGLILPRTKLFGAEAPSNKLNVALIGTWGRGEAHFAGLATENVVALCDINEEHLAYGARKFPNAKRYFDLRNLLQQKDIEAVVSCSLANAHALRPVDSALAFPHLQSGILQRRAGHELLLQEHVLGFGPRPDRGNRQPHNGPSLECRGRRPAGFGRGQGRSLYPGRYTGQI